MNHIGHSVKNKKKINKWGYEFSTKLEKESCSVIIKSPLVITQSQNFAKGTPHEKCTRKVQMQRTEELPVEKEILKK